MDFLFKQKVLFKHCDPAGIVFYPRYFEMINDCVEAFFDEALHLPFETLLQDAAVPTAHIDAAFKAPSRHGDMLSLALRVVKLGRSSVELKISATCGEHLRFTSSVTLVYITLVGRSQPWTDDLRTSFQTYLGEPA